MSAPPKPADLDDAVAQLWYVVIGMNGDGLTSKVSRILDILEKRERDDADCAIKAATDAAHAATKARERRKMSAREWSLIAATALPTLLLVYVSWKLGAK